MSIDDCLLTYRPSHSQVKVEVLSEHYGAKLKIIKKDENVHTFHNYFMTLYNGWVRVKHNGNYHWYATEDISNLIEENPIPIHDGSNDSH